jgi:ribosomal 50S subunit-recycling heat shock protein
MTKKPSLSQSAVIRQRYDKWIRMNELPIGRTLATRLIQEGVIVSVLVCAPGSKRGVRLVSTESLETYLNGLVNKGRETAGV